MSILDNIKDKAKDLLKMSEPYATRATTGYDASKNSIVVAGFPLDGVVSSNISSDTIMRQETGIDYYYTACLLYTSPSPRDKRQSRMPSSA